MTFSPWTINDTFAIAKWITILQVSELHLRQAQYGQIFGVMPSFHQSSRGEHQELRSIPPACQKMSISVTAQNDQTRPWCSRESRIQCDNTTPCITQYHTFRRQKLPRGVAIEDSEGNYLTTSVDDGVVFLNNIKPDMVLDIKDEQQSCRIHLTFPEDAPKDVFYETATGECQ